MSALALFNRRDPFADFDALVRGAFGSRPAFGGFTPSAEIAKDGDDAVIRVEVPGVDVDNDISVELEDHRLVVRGERRDESTEEHDGRTLREIRYGGFERSFTMPAHVTSDEISASYDAGVLTVRVAGAHTEGGKQRISVERAEKDAA